MVMMLSRTILTIFRLPTHLDQSTVAVVVAAAHKTASKTATCFQLLICHFIDLQFSFVTEIPMDQPETHRSNVPDGMNVVDNDKSIAKTEAPVICFVESGAVSVVRYHRTLVSCSSVKEAIMAVIASYSVLHVLCVQHRV